MSYNPTIQTGSGQTISLRKNPQAYQKAVANDIRNMLGRKRPFFGREREEQRRLSQVGEILGTLPPHVSQQIYQDVFPMRLAAALPNGRMVKVGVRPPSVKSFAELGELLEKIRPAANPAYTGPVSKAESLVLRKVILPNKKTIILGEGSARKARTIVAKTKAVGVKPTRKVTAETKRMAIKKELDKRLPRLGPTMSPSKKPLKRDVSLSGGGGGRSKGTGGGSRAGGGRPKGRSGGRDIAGGEKGKGGFPWGWTAAGAGAAGAGGYGAWRYSKNKKDVERYGKEEQKAALLPNGRMVKVGY